MIGYRAASDLRVRRVWVVSDSLFRGYNPPADVPYGLYAMMAMRADRARGWTEADRPLRFVGSRYAGTGIIGRSTASDVEPAATIEDKLAGYVAARAALSASPTDILFACMLNGLADDATQIERVRAWFALARASDPSARLWVVAPWWYSGQPAARLALQQRVEAGEAGGDVSVITWRNQPQGCLGLDGVHQTLPASPAQPNTWVNTALSFGTTIAWSMRQTLEGLYGTHRPGALCAPRTLTTIAGETWP